MGELDSGSGATLSPQYSHVFEALDLAVERSRVELEAASARLAAVHQAAENLNKLGITSEIINGEVLAGIEDSVQQADFDYSILSLVRLAVPTSIIMSPETESPADPTDPALAESDDTRRAALVHLDSALVATLDAGGGFVSDSRYGVGGEVRKILGISNSVWAQVRYEGEKSGLMHFNHKSARVIDEVRVDQEALAAAIDKGEISSEVAEAYDRLLQRKTESEAQPEGGGTSFLAKGVGKEVGQSDGAILDFPITAPLESLEQIESSSAGAEQSISTPPLPKDELLEPRKRAKRSDCLELPFFGVITREDWTCIEPHFRFALALDDKRISDVSFSSHDELLEQAVKIAGLATEGMPLLHGDIVRIVKPLLPHITMPKFPINIIEVDKSTKKLQLTLSGMHYLKGVIKRVQNEVDYIKDAKRVSLLHAEDISQAA